MSKHTKGPWKVLTNPQYEDHSGNDIFEIHSANDEVICSFESGDGETEVAAHLMAAAPDMLEALQMVRSLFVAVSQLSKATSGDQNIFETIEKAIAKAEGEENEI